MEVELRVDEFVPGAFELGVQDTVDDTDVLCGLTEVLAAQNELAVYVPEEGVERDGRRDIGLLVRFLALRRENAIVDDDFATGGGDRHRASFISDVKIRET